MLRIKFLGTMLDHKINREYDLYSINARKIQSLVEDTYLKTMSKTDIQLFNEDLKYFEKVRHLKQLKRRKEQRLLISRHYKIEEIEKELEEIVKAIKNKEHHSTKLQKLNELGYELMPIAVSVKNKDIKNGNDIELLDGFRRLFFTPNVPDTDILVKVYDELTDAEWINSMIVFNSWKFANTSGAKVYMDRGFRLGLYYRYGTDFTEFYSDYTNFQWKFIDIYTKDFPYATFWDNSYAHLDIELIYKLIEYRPVFKLEKKRAKTIEIYDVEQENPAHFPTFLEKLYKLIISTLGDIRRREFGAELKGHKVERKPFDYDFIIDIFTQKDLQKHFMKLASMQVPGFMDNYIQTHLLEIFEDYLRKGYFKDKIDTFVQKAKFIQVIDKKRTLWAYELKKELDNGSSVVYNYKDRQLGFEKQDDKYVMDYLGEQTIFEDFKEILEYKLEGSDKEFAELSRDMELLFIL